MLAFKEFYIVAIELLALFTLCVAAPSYKQESAKFPAFIKRCRRTDLNINACVRDAINSLKTRIPQGIPELFVPPLEPLVVPEIRMDQDSGAIYMHSTYTDIHMHGLSNYTLTDVSIEPEKMRLSMTMSFPNVSMNAHYMMKGKIMMMPLMGDGDCKANFTDVELNIIITGERSKKHGSFYIKVKHIKTKYTLGDTNIRLENLFNGDSALGERMNSFLNENWESLSEEIRPLLEDAMAEIVRASTDKLFNAYSYDELLPE